MKKIWFPLVLSISSVFLTLLVLEILYRYQVIDFYSLELKALNDPGDLKAGDSKKTILVGGDSFTAEHQSYVRLLREKFPKYRIINAAVPGTGIMQASFILPERIKEFNPDILIYQVYVGNDLLDIRHPLDWEKLSVLRNVYWWLSDKFRVIAYLNYKAGFLKPPFERGFYDSKIDYSFSVEKYSEREKLYFKAEPHLIENSALLKNGRDKDMEMLIEKFNEIRANLRRETKCYILLIPHCAQVNGVYFERIKQTGAVFSDADAMMETNYPFIRALENNFSRAGKVNILNPLEALCEADLHDTPVFYANDPHLTPSGQKVIADFLLSNLIEN